MTHYVSKKKKKKLFYNDQHVIRNIYAMKLLHVTEYQNLTHELRADFVADCEIKVILF